MRDLRQLSVFTSIHVELALELAIEFALEPTLHANSDLLLIVAGEDVVYLHVSVSLVLVRCELLGDFLLWQRGQDHGYCSAADPLYFSWYFVGGYLSDGSQRLLLPLDTGTPNNTLSPLRVVMLPRHWHSFQYSLCVAMVQTAVVGVGVHGNGHGCFLLDLLLVLLDGLGPGL